MRTFTKIAIASLSLAAAPALAQSQMPHDGATPSDQPAAAAPMTGSEEATMAKCKAKTHEAAMRDQACIAAMKNAPHPTKEAPSTSPVKPNGADNHNGTPHGQPATTPKP